jgi:hypothetical protein
VHYLRAAHEIGLRDFATVATMLPRPASWIYMGETNWLYARLWRLPLFRAIPAEHEQRLGLGFVTAGVALFGLWPARRTAYVGLMLLTALTIVVLVTRWTPALVPWLAVYHALPGAADLRAASSFGMMLLFPASLGVALAVERLSGRRWRALLAGLAIVIVAEQGQAIEWFSKDVARARAALVARAVPAGCASFLYTPVAQDGDPWWYHGDAMWAALQRGLPTVNGYSGNLPPGWSFYDAIARTPRQDSLLTEGLAEWSRRWRLEPGAVCRVRIDEPESIVGRE